MKTKLNIIALVALLLVAPSPCFALWVHARVSNEKGKDLGLEVRTAAVDPNHVRVELEFKTEGTFEGFSPDSSSKYRSGVELRIGQGDKPLLTAALKEDHSKKGRVVVGFTAQRDQFDLSELRVSVPESDGGTIYILRVKDFVEPKKDR
jgi:hypothetical protein